MTARPIRPISHVASDIHSPFQKNLTQEARLLRLRKAIGNSCCERAAMIPLGAYTPLKAEKPPSTGITTPVTNSEAGESSHNTQPKRSFDSPSRPIGVCPTIVLPRGVQSPVSLSSIRKRF